MVQMLVIVIAERKDFFFVSIHIQLTKQPHGGPQAD